MDRGVHKLKGVPDRCRLYLLQPELLHYSCRSHIQLVAVPEEPQRDQKRSQAIDNQH